MNLKVLIPALLVAGVLIIASYFLISNNSGNNQEASTTVNETVPTQAPETSEVTPTETQAEEVMVELTSAGFSPRTITIDKGTKVVWTNNSGRAATVDSNPHPIHTSYPEMNLGNFQDGETMEFVFPNSGTFNYHNHLNAGQGGTVIVK